MAGLVTAPITVSAADLAGGGPASVANIIANTQLQRAQAEQLIPAQAQLAESQAGLVGQQTKQASIETQLKGLDLQYRVASINAAREAFNRMNSGEGATPASSPPVQNPQLPGQGTVVPAATGPQGPSPTTPVSQIAQPAPTTGAGPQVGAAPQVSAAVGGPPPMTPTSQVGPSGQPIAVGGAPPQGPSPEVIQQRAAAAKEASANIDQSSHESVLQHAATIPYTAMGIPNTLSDQFLTAVRDITIRNGGDPIMANNAYIAGTKARNELTKGYADSVKAGNDAIKAGADAETAQAAAQTAITESKNNVAYQALTNAGSNFATAQGYARSLNLDLNNQQDVVTLKAMAAGSSLGQRQKTVEVSNYTALQNAASTRISAIAAQTNAQVNQKRLTLDQAHQAMELAKDGATMQTKASLMAQGVDAGTIAQQDINALRLLSNPAIPRKNISTSEANIVLAKEGLPQSIIDAMIQSGVRTTTDDKTITFVDINKRLASQLSELQQRMIAGSGGTGSLGTVAGAKTISEAIANLNPGNELNAYVRNLDAAQRYVDMATDNINQMHNSYNQYLTSGIGKNSGFGPINPALPKTEPLYMVPGTKSPNPKYAGYVYRAGRPDLQSSWVKQ